MSEYAYLMPFSHTAYFAQDGLNSHKLSLLCQEDLNRQNMNFEI